MVCGSHTSLLEGRVLVVDDTPTIRILTKAVLAKAGFEVQLASDGKEALGLLMNGQSCFDLVILDLNMPEMSGEEVVAELIKQRRRIPIVLCSGSVTRMAEVAALSQGMVHGRIAKPFCVQGLVEMVRSVLRARGPSLEELSEAA